MAQDIENNFHNFIQNNIGISKNTANTTNKKLVKKILLAKIFWLNQYKANKLKPQTINKVSEKCFLIHEYQKGNEITIQIIIATINEPLILNKPKKDNELVKRSIPARLS